MAGAVHVAGAGMLALLTVWVGVTTDGSPLAFILGYALGAAGATVRVPSLDRRRWTLLPIVILGMALSGAPPWPGTVAALAGGLSVEALVRLRGAHIESSAAVGACAMVVAIGVFDPLEGLALAAPPSVAPAEMAGALLVAASWFAVESTFAVLSWPDWRNATWYRVRRALADGPIALVAVSAVIAFAALSAHSLAWAVIVAAVPYAITHHLGVRLSRGRLAADLTVRALGRLPEAAGLSPAGHARSVTELAVSLGRLYGLAGGELVELELAAQLHDLGLVAASRTGEYSAADVAAWGSQILGTSKALSPAAAIVAATRDPYRVPGRDPVHDRDVRAQIVQVACRLVSALETGRGLDDAVEELYENSRYQLDPTIVALVRRATLAAPSLHEERR